MIFELHIVKFYFRLWELSNYKWFNLIYVVQLLLAINLILSQVLQKHGSSQKLARFEIPQAVFLVRFYRKFTLGPQNCGIWRRLLVSILYIPMKMKHCNCEVLTDIFCVHCTLYKVNFKSTFKTKCFT